MILIKIDDIGSQVKVTDKLSCGGIAIDGWPSKTV